MIDQMCIVMRFQISVLLGAFVNVHDIAQDAEPLRTNFVDPATRYVQLGAAVNLNFEVNRGPLFVLANSVFLVRKQIHKDGTETQHIISEGTVLKDGEPKYYNVSMNMEQLDPSAKEMAMHAEIKETRDIDDAHFVVSAVNKGSPMSEAANSSVHVVILRPIEKVEVQVGNLAPFHNTMKSPFQLDAKVYTVMCTVEGSNPEPDEVVVSWNGKPAQLVSSKDERMDGALVKYRTVVKYMINVTVNTSGQVVDCVAKSKDGTTKQVKAPIKVNIYEPDVMCKNSQAFLSQRYFEINCIVDELNLEIEDYGFEFGKTGEVLYVSDQNAKYDTVAKEMTEDSKVKVTLTLYQVEGSHFGDYYLVVKHKNGHVSRQAVVLEQTQGPGGGAAELGLSLTVLVFSTLMALFHV